MSGEINSQDISAKTETPSHRYKMEDLVTEFYTLNPAMNGKIYFTSTDEGRGFISPSDLAPILKPYFDDRTRKQGIRGALSLGDIVLFLDEQNKRPCAGMLATQDSWVGIVNGLRNNPLDTIAHIYGKMQSEGDHIGVMKYDAALKAFGSKLNVYMQVHTFDHELGHILTKHLEQKIINSVAFKQVRADGAQPNAYSEAMADTYGAIRHIQRFGWDTGFLDFICGLRAHRLIHHDSVGHYTVESIKAVMALKGKIDLKNLSPEETVTLAARIADETRIDLDDGQKLKEVFNASGYKHDIAHAGDMALLVAQQARASNSLLSMNCARLYVGDIALNFQPATPLEKEAIAQAYALLVKSTTTTAPQAIFMRMQA